MTVTLRYRLIITLRNHLTVTLRYLLSITLRYLGRHATLFWSSRNANYFGRLITLSCRSQRLPFRNSVDVHYSFGRLHILIVVVLYFHAGVMLNMYLPQVRIDWKTGLAPG